MSAKQNWQQVIKKRIPALILKVTVGLLLFLFVTISVVSIPYVQTVIINKITDKVLASIGYEVDLDYINIRWFDTILLNGVTVKDLKGNDMIKVDKMILDFKIGHLITSNSINFDKAILVGAKVAMIKNAPDGNFNLNDFIDRMRDAFSGNGGGGGHAKAFVVDKIILNGSHYSMYRPDRDPLPNQFDYNHFALSGIVADVHNFLLKPGLLSFDVNNLQCLDSATMLDVKQLNTRFIYTSTSMVFQNMTASIGHSKVEQSMVFEYKQPSSLREFEDSVDITANIKKSLFFSRDLALFFPGMYSHDQYYRVKGFLEGPIHRFDAKSVTVEFGNKSRLEGYISLYGLPNLTETFINAKINSADFYPRDLEPYLDSLGMATVEKLGEVRFNGRFSGFMSDFVSNAEFNTQLGYVKTDINLKLNPTNVDMPTYSGRLVTKDFNLGEFLGDTTNFQKLDMDGKITGEGFTKETARFDLNSEIQRIGIKSYEYHNILTDAAMAEQFFNGSLKIHDPNLQFEAYASIDLRENRDIIKIEASLDTAFLQPLHLTDKHAFVRTGMKVDMTGLQLDKMLGQVHLNNTQVEYNGQQLNIDTLTLISAKDSLSRSLTVRGPNVMVHLFGDFNYSTFFMNASDVFKEYRLIFQNDSASIGRYYANKHTTYSDYYYLDYDVNLKDISPIVRLFYPGFYISKNTEITGSFTGGPMSIIELNSDFKRLDYDHISFRNNSVHINSSKSADTTYVYGEYYAKSEKQYFDDEQRSGDLLFNVEWKENHIRYNMDIHQSGEDNYAKLSGNVDFYPGETRIEMLPGELKAIEKIWHFADNNRVTIKNGEFDFRNLQLVHDDQHIAVNGKISRNPGDDLFITIQNFEMVNLNPLLAKNFKGVINGDIDVKNYFGNKEINSRLVLKQFEINTFLVGDILATSSYENSLRRFKVNFNVTRKGMKTMDIGGYLTPYSQEDQIDLSAKFMQSNLNIIEPFIEENVSQLKGHLDGDMKVEGRFDHPVVKGDASISDGEFTFNYLKTHYHFNSKLVFDNDKIDVGSFDVRDEFNNRGTFSGRVTHNGFKQLSFDFSGETANLQVLNTTLRDNKLYYGTAYATGKIRVYGQQKNVYIDASARSGKGTRIFIPLAGSTEVAQEDFITFVQPKDSTLKKDEDEPFRASNKINLEGVSMNLDLDLTPDAYCEIIFDLTAGDIIRGRGNGKLNLQIDTKGEFYMFGDYVIEQGAYNFTLYNIINKEFQIEPNSKITWLGDPYGAFLDIKAIYKQMASLAPILKATEDDLKNNPELKRKYPADVILDIKGNLKSPTINFDIDIDDYPKNAVLNGISLETQVTAFKNKLATDEQELKRQVFSLIILKNFSTEDAFNVGGSVGKSVSEFISNQISYWISQFDENLEVDVDLGALDAEAFNTFQLRLSYSFMGGRLRVTRDGGFTDQNSNANLASVLGDWSVEYLLTDDGRYRLKIYNKTNYNTLNPALKSTSTTAGFSLLNTLSFDQLGELFKKGHNASTRKKLILKDSLPSTNDSLLSGQHMPRGHRMN